MAAASILVVHETWGYILPHLLASIAYIHYPIFHTPSVLNSVAWSLEIEVQFYILDLFIALASTWASIQQQQALKNGQQVSGGGGGNGRCPNGKYYDPSVHCVCDPHNAQYPLNCSIGNNGGAASQAPASTTATPPAATSSPATGPAQAAAPSPELEALQQQERQILEQLRAQAAGEQDATHRQQLQNVENLIASMMREQQNEAAGESAAAQQASQTQHASQQSIFSYNPSPAPGHNPPAPPSTTTSQQQPAPCYWVSDVVGCLPQSTWQQIANAPDTYTPPTNTPTGPVQVYYIVNADIPDGPGVHWCPKSGVIHTGYYTANDVWLGQTDRCTVGFHFRISWPSMPGTVTASGGAPGIAHPALPAPEALPAAVPGAAHPAALALEATVITSLR